MRFKASLRMPHVNSLWAHMLMMERVGKNVVLVFSDASVRAVVHGEGDSLMQYSTLITHALFDSFRCESRMDNIIAIEVLVVNLVEGLRPALTSEAVTIKLTKREAAQYLRAEMKPHDGGVALVQDIPVRVIGGVEMMRYTPPNLPTTLVHALLPAPRSVVAVVDRMKSLTKVVSVDVDMGAGRGAAGLATVALTLTAHHELVRIKTFYVGLLPGGAAAEHGGDDSAGAGAGSKGAAASCTVNLKDFSKVLRGVVGIAADTAVQTTLSIVPGTACLLHVALEDGTGAITIIHTVLDSGSNAE